jgi:hypothetical protein
MRPALDRVELFDANGTPNGSETSASAAVSRACSSSTKQTAWSFDTFAAASEPSRASLGEIVPDRKASTSEQASPIHGAPVTGGQASESCQLTAMPNFEHSNLVADLSDA